MPYRVEITAGEFGYVDPRGGFLTGLVKGIGHVIGGVASGIGATIASGGNPIKGVQAIIAYDKKAGIIGGDHPAAPVGGSDAGHPALPPPGAVPMLPAMNMSAAPSSGQDVTAGLPSGVVTHSPLGTPVTQAAIARQVKALHAGHRKRRTMRWSNTKALGRAERRIHSAVKHFSKYMRLVHPHKTGHYAAKFGRKKR